ncbi:MAG: ribosome maturation factor RimP [Oscillospiraceae bacterium]|nr:ribosome maturation factor RimP [Oscillospiraceae bacterium]
MGKVTDAVEALAGPIAVGMGLELVEVELVREGGAQVLRLCIDKPAGVGHSDCEALSRAVEHGLDAIDAMLPEPYTLEVSSPGLDRVLKKDSEYAKYSGEEVELRLYKAVGGRKKVTGRLVGLDGGHIVILGADGAEARYERSGVSSTRKVPSYGM